MANDHFIYLGTTPWKPTLLSDSQIGEGTDYPLDTGLDDTIMLYWEPKLLTMILSVRLETAPGSGVFLDMTGEATGNQRASQPVELGDGGGVGASVSFSQEYPTLGPPHDDAHLSFTFELLPDSAYGSSASQHILMRGGGIVGYDGEAYSDTNLSTRVAYDTQCGHVGVSEVNKTSRISIPLFADGSRSVVADISILWLPWDFA